MTDELRNTKRYPCKARFFAAGAAQTFRGEVQDVSDTGLSMVTNVSLAKGKDLHIEFELPTGRVEAVVEVRWMKTREDGMNELGLRFIRLPEESSRAITAATLMPTYKSRMMREWVFA